MAPARGSSRQASRRRHASTDSSDEATLPERLSRLPRAHTELAFAAALERLGPRGRRVLYAELPGDVAQSLAAIFGERVPAPKPLNAKRLSPAAFREEWQRRWKHWDALIAATNREGDGGYLQHEISYNSPDLDQVRFARDLDHAAKGLAPLVVRAADEELVAGFDFGRKLVQSMARVANRVASYVIASDEGTALGPEVTSLTLEWCWRRSRARGDKRAEAFARSVRGLRERLADAGLGAGLDEDAVDDFVGRLPAADQKRVEAAGLDPEFE